MKKSAEYPLKYGQRVRKLHQDHVALWLNLSDSKLDGWIIDIEHVCVVILPLSFPFVINEADHPRQLRATLYDGPERPWKGITEILQARLNPPKPIMENCAETSSFCAIAIEIPSALLPSLPPGTPFCGLEPGQSWAHQDVLAGRDQEGKVPSYFQGWRLVMTLWSFMISGLHFHLTPHDITWHCKDEVGWFQRSWLNKYHIFWSCQWCSPWTWTIIRGFVMYNSRACVQSTLAMLTHACSDRLHLAARSERGYREEIPNISEESLNFDA